MTRLTIRYDDSVDEVIEEECEESKSGWIRKAIHEKVARDTDAKRHVFCEDPVELELTEFEALFVANVLWDYSSQSDREDECKWIARKIHELRKTRDDGF